MRRRRIVTIKCDKCWRKGYKELRIGSNGCATFIGWTRFELETDAGHGTKHIRLCPKCTKKWEKKLLPCQSKEGK